MNLGDDPAPLLHWTPPAQAVGVADMTSCPREDVPADLLLNTIRAAVAIADLDGRILVANPALAALLGLPPRDLIGRPFSACLRLLPAADANVSGAPAAATGHRADGSEFPAEVAVTRIEHDGAAQLVITVRDVTDRHRVDRAMHEVHDLTEQLRRAQKIGALGRLAGGVAHDFNNLLQVISGYAEALGAERLDQPARRRLLRTIRGATDRASSLTRQLLAFGRRQVLVPEVVDLNVTVRALERMTSRVIGEHIQFVSVLTPDLDAVRVDPGQIEQVLLNLVLNARDAMPGGGLVEIATANVRRAAAWSTPLMPVTVPDGSWVLVTVRDTGSGMDADTAAQAFEPFFTTKDASLGSGLGLSMVYGIVKQSGGYTWIDSAPGHGTTVHVLLPGVADAVPRADARVDGPRPGPLPVPHGGILLVEDDPEVRALFSSFLRQAGYDVIEAADGRDAIDAFNARQADIDIVITDVVMPNTSGPALASALRARSPLLKILYVSGYAEQLEFEGGSPPGFAYLQKPVTRLALLRQVAALLAPPEPAAPPPPGSPAPPPRRPE